MPTDVYKPSVSLIVSCLATVLTPLIAAAPSSEQVKRDNNNPLGIDWSPAPSPEDGPPGAANALRDPAYLPAQIGGIVGSYALSLVLVAIILLSLSKRRRERLRAAEDFDLWEEPRLQFDFPEPYSAFHSQDQIQDDEHPYPACHEIPKTHIRNFSLPSPTSTTFHGSNNGSVPYIFTSPGSSIRGVPGVDPDVDQSIVAQDRNMAQAQLEEMYKYVMEQEAAKEAGVEYKGPAYPAPFQNGPFQNKSTSTLVRKERNKPANLNLSEAKSEKTQSRTSSILSALKSPGRRKKHMQGISISSPIMTPMSGTFPPQVGEEMNAIPPRHYAPAQPPPVPAGHGSFSQRRNTGQLAPLTPPDDRSPESTMSIDERLGALTSNPLTSNPPDHQIREEDETEEEAEQRRQEEQQYYQSRQHSRHQSAATADPDPVSAISDTSQTPLVGHVGLPTSPKPGVNRFPSLSSLPSSPKPGATFSRPNAPSAVRTGGALPLRAYEPALTSPNSYDRHFKQTTFERAMPLSPGLHTARTPGTGMAVPYSPYQPFSPVMPITPSLVTREDRKRMKRMVPKTPTLDMVQSSDDVW